jgi:D-alanine-D-alanine ligase
MNVTVLCGGPGAEREISLVSGNAIALGLKRAGHNVHIADANPRDLSALDRPADVIFPAMHGEFGESGELQEILERRNLAFVGSGSAASRAGINKVHTKRLWLAADLPTPAWQTFNETTIGAIDGAAIPCVVKGLNGGSSIDVFVCKDANSLKSAAKHVVDTYGEGMVEQFVTGTELTIGFLDEQPLPPIRILTKRGFFDFEAKYRDKTTEYRFEPGVSNDVLEEAIRAASRAYQVLGCRDLGRVDLIISTDGRPYLLEINTMPGFTATSLLPKAASRAGLAFEDVVDRLVQRAYQRQAARTFSKAS